jgi:hypothetical protein
LHQSASKRGHTVARSYRAYCGEKLLGTYSELKQALAALSGCSETIRVERCEEIMVLAPDEYSELALPIKPREREAKTVATAQRNEGKRGTTAIVFDQMFKRFAEILDRELSGLNVEFHEIIGRGLEKPIRVSNRIYQEPAHDDYDVLSLLEKLSNKHSKVIFFTGDRRLAAQARALPGVHVVYLPPGEVAGKEMAIKLMKKEILKEVDKGR